MVFIVCMHPADEWERSVSLVTMVRERLQQIPIVAVLPSEEQVDEQHAAISGSVDVTAHSFKEAVAHAGLRFSIPGRQVEL